MWPEHTVSRKKACRNSLLRQAFCSEWRITHSNTPRFLRETRHFLREAVQNPVQLVHGAVQMTPIWRLWSRHGLTCPKRSGPTSWRWSRRPAGTLRGLSDDRNAEKAVPTPRSGGGSLGASKPARGVATTWGPLTRSPENDPAW